MDGQFYSKRIEVKSMRTLTDPIPRYEAVRQVIETGILPAVKLNEELDMVPYFQAMWEEGVRVVEITTTSVGAYERFEALSNHFAGKLLFAAGTVLDANTAREVIRRGCAVVVSPAMVPEVIETAHTYGAACFIGAFSATECLGAMRAGADMVKIFPAALGGPKYMANLRMVYPDLALVPSGGINLENAGDFIRYGASAVSGARSFFDVEQVKEKGEEWIRDQMRSYLSVVAEARELAAPLP